MQVRYRDRPPSRLLVLLPLPRDYPVGVVYDGASAVLAGPDLDSRERGHANYSRQCQPIHLGS
jgi:hypothetical protein